MHEILAKLDQAKFQRSFSSEYLYALEMTRRNQKEYSIGFEKELARNFFSKGQLTADTDIIKTFDKDTVVEAHLIPGLVQVFRSLNFLQFGSYDLATLMEMPFTDLYFREEFVNRLIAKEFERAMLGENKFSKFFVPRHPLKEIYKDHQKTYEMECCYITPIYESSQPVGVLFSYKATEV